MTPSTIGRYEIKSELGRGGMASVYSAYDPRFKRDVAIKVLPREFLHDPMFLARFQREAETIAALEHPTIVPVYDFGEEDGQPYLVMRYMPGGSLADHIKKGPMPLAEAARIVERLAAALDEAHTRGIIHRDLKPGNILFDQRSDSFLSDFGIVKLSQQSTDGDLTGDGVVGTPAYMSPEQARGEGALDGRSDVYALGAILFEMLAGHQPFRAETPIGLIVKHLSDPVPSILAIRPDLPEDIEAIMDKALAKDRDQRYQTAGDLARAVNAVVRGQPVDDIPYATMPIPIPDVSGSADSLTTMPAIPGPAPATFEHKAEATVGAGVERRPNNWLLVGGAALGVIILAAVVSLLVTSLDKLGIGESSTVVSPEGLGQLAAVPAATVSVASHQIPAPEGAVARLGRGTLNAIALSPDGKQVAVGGGVGVLVYDGQSFEQQWIGQTSRPVSSVAFSPDGKTLAAGLDNGGLLLLDASTGNKIREAFPHSDLVTGVAWSPDSGQIATASADSTLSLVDVATGETIRSLTGHTGQVLSVAFSPDGKHLISGSEDKMGRLWDIDTGTSETLVGHSNWVFGVGYSPDGKMAITASLDGELIAWDTARREQIGQFTGTGEGLVSASVSPDGKLIAAGGTDGALLVWDMTQPGQARSLRGHSRWIATLAWTADSRNLFSGSFDNTVIVWDATTAQPLQILQGHTDWVTAVAFGPQIATGSANGDITLWDAQSFQPQYLSAPHDKQVNGLAFSPDGSQLASVSDDKTVILWNIGANRKLHVLTDHPGRVTAVAFSPDGTRLATSSCTEPDPPSGCKGGEIRLWDRANGQLDDDPLIGHTNVITALAWVDNVTLVSGSADGTLIAWNTTTGKPGVTFQKHTAAVNSVAVSPDGTLIASGANDSNVMIWDATTGEVLHTMTGHTRDVRSVAFSPDGKWLASGSDDRSVIVWNVAQGEEFSQLTGHNSGVRSVTWSPDGKLILSGSMDGTTILWNAPSDLSTG